MADQNRKNIYIPEDQAEMFKKAEEFAKNNDMSLSTLVVQAVDKFISRISKNAGEVSLMLRTYSDHSVIPKIKYIKFNGERIAQSNYLSDSDKIVLDKNGSLTKPEYVVCDLFNYIQPEDYVGHQYTIYKTQKGKYLVYTDREHSRYFGEDEQILRRECYYDIYDDLKSLVGDLSDLDFETIDELAKHECTTEYLDI